jgi:intracellular sulfur oxidation DsrE/DsrF family protein
MISHTLNVFRLLLLATALTLPALPAGAQGDADDADAIVKVAYHADFADPRRFSAMLTSINNLVTFYQNELIDYDVRIVFVAHGIRFLTSDKLKDTPFSSDAALEERRDNLRGRLSALQSVQDVKLELCDITRIGIGLPEDALYKGVELVPSGVVRIADLQTRGYAYIKIE